MGAARFGVVTRRRSHLGTLGGRRLLQRKRGGGVGAAAANHDVVAGGTASSRGRRGRRRAGAASRSHLHHLRHIGHVRANRDSAEAQRSAHFQRGCMHNASQPPAASHRLSTGHRQIHGNKKQPISCARAVPCQKLRGWWVAVVARAWRSSASGTNCRDDMQLPVAARCISR